jgi:hypothetical protein
MPSDPSLLDPRAVSAALPQLHSGEIADSAASESDLVRCVVPAVDSLLGTIAMDWDPVSRSSGLFFPKRGDKALVAIPGDGPPWIVRWRPTAAVPDVPAP